MTKDTITRSYKITRETATLIDALADENNEYKSTIIESAIREYADADRNARIETKVDEALAILRAERSGDTPSGEENAKKKNRGSEPKPDPDSESVSDSSDSASAVERRADNMYGILLERVNREERDRLTREQAEQAIASVVSNSDYAIEQYLPRLESRLDDDGWIDIQHTDWYARNDRAAQAILEQFVGDDLQTLSKAAHVDTHRLHAAIRRISDNQGNILRTVVDDPEPVITLLGDATSVYESRS